MYLQNYLKRPENQVARERLLAKLVSLLVTARHA
jgi:hypothetical protein